LTSVLASLPENDHTWFQSPPTVQGPDCFSTTTVGPALHLPVPILQVMHQGWYERGKQKLVAEGKRLFQAKTILLDAKAGYHAEPHEVEAEERLG
jgi:hypothetical protein